MTLGLAVGHFCDCDPIHIISDQTCDLAGDYVGWAYMGHYLSLSDCISCDHVCDPSFGDPGLVIIPSYRLSFIMET